MTRLVLETTYPLTRIEVMDWLGSMGFTTYDVRPISGDDPAAGRNYQFGFTTSDSSARRALTVLPGLTIGPSGITVRLDDTDQEVGETVVPPVL
jgi:hypothetical protein